MNTTHVHYTLQVTGPHRAQPSPLVSILNNLHPALSDFWCQHYWLVVHQQIHRFPRNAYLEKIALKYQYKPERSFLSGHLGSRLISLVFRDEKSMSEYLDEEDHSNLEVMLELLPLTTFTTADQAIGYTGDVRSLVAMESCALRKGYADALIKFQPLDMSFWVMVREGVDLDLGTGIFQVFEDPKG